ncbi:MULTISPECIES: MipA/OmpV family protein [unclassified Cedecea]|uniref:MipA/OmpV family protein n=1 Tax=unclassified Cedecea TaxID=2649846 RepID=UPI003018A182
MKKSLAISAFALSLLFPVLGQAEDGKAYLTVGGGVAFAPAYQGADKYRPTALYDLSIGYSHGSWGSVSLGNNGLSWALPLDEPFGVALLLDYDSGRDEVINTLDGKDRTLKGMGDLGGALQAGVELSYLLDPFRSYVKVLQATKKRHYGGEDLGRTLLAELGVGTVTPLNDRFSLQTNLSTTWANSGYQRGYFGVTPEQAQRTAFSTWRPGSGFKDVTLTAALNYEWTQNIALQAGAGVTALVGDAADSPIVAKKVATLSFVSASYSF